MRVFLVACLMLFSTAALAADSKMGWNGPISGTLAASGTVYHKFELESFKPYGFFSLQATTAGSGTVTITYELSNVPAPGSSDWVAVSVTAIATDKAAGTAFYQFPVSGEAIFAKWIRLKLAETTTTDTVTYTLYPNVQ